MTAITAALVKELREKTSAGMMECKKALEATKGDIQLAIEELRKSGILKAAKRAGKAAAEGIVVTLADADQKSAMMIEVNSETDFVGRDESFVSFAKATAETAWDTKTADINKLATLPLKGHGGQTVEDARQALISKVGENVLIRRIVFSNTLTNPAEQTIGVYRHGERIGVVVELDADNKELAKDIAMHIAANRPVVINPEDVSEDLVQKEKEIYSAQAETSGKPKEIIEKMVQGKLKNFLNDISLIGQPFIKNPDVTVGELLNKNRTKVIAFHRYEVGEGIEKVEEDFAQAVMSQIQGS
ncbi:MAG TPA: translation elongation factor Ts [Gammaproteobacteria bacterium]|nr:translation elongation factor Ts [Gammaproteobacteria bacterium]